MDYYPVNRALTDPPLPFGCEREPLLLISMIFASAMMIVLSVQAFAWLIPILILWGTCTVILRKLAHYDPRYFDRALRRLRISIAAKSSWK